MSPHDPAARHLARCPGGRSPDQGRLVVAHVPLSVGAQPVDDGREVRAALTIERGRRMLDLREFALFAGVLMPGKNGLTLPVEHIDALAGLLAEAAARAKAEGWLSEDGRPA